MKKIPNPELIDDENPEWTDARFARAVKAADLPKALQAKLGWPFYKKISNKQRITIRLSAEVVDEFRNSGAGWQTRIDAVLQNWLRTHSADQAPQV